jgi:hypothetical protein
MVIGAKEDQVVEIGGTSVQPKADVMGIEPALMVATGEPASLIPSSKGSHHPGRDRAPGSTDPERHPITVFGDDLQPAVTTETPHRLDR